MHKQIVSTCSPNNNMYWVCIQYIVKIFPDGLFLVTPYVPRIDRGNQTASYRYILSRPNMWNYYNLCVANTRRVNDFLLDEYYSQVTDLNLKFVEWSTENMRLLIENTYSMMLVTGWTVLRFDADNLWFLQ